MSISNKNYFLLWRILLGILIMILLGDLLLSQINGSIGQYFSNHIPALISGLLILILACIRINYFSYEDEYEIIHIRSKSLIFGSFEGPAQTRYEFPKRIIYDFHLKNGLFHKRLTICLITQQGVKKVRKFNLTFVPMAKLRYVTQSLDSIKRNNEELQGEGGLKWT